MNILWVPQISSLSHEGKVLANKDSNMAVLNNMSHSKLFESNYIFVAFEFSKANVESDGLNKYHGVFFDESRTFTNAKAERLNFNVNYFIELKEKLAHIDIVFVNEPTKVLPLKEIFANSKVVTYNHWLAFKNMPELHMRQIEGMMAADACFVNSNYVIEQVLNRYKDYEGIEHINLIKMQPSYPDGINCTRMKSIKVEAAMRGNIIYNHRLSSDKYYKQAFDDFVKVCNRLEYSLGVDGMPTVYFTNPSGKEIDLKSIKPYFKELNLATQDDYFDFLKSNDVGIHINSFFESQGMWSMSTVDCALSGNICLLPFRYGYAEIFDSQYKGYCNSIEEMADKLLNIITTRTAIFNYYAGMDISKHSGRAIGDKLNDVLYNIVYANKAERPWGSYRILYETKKMKLKILKIKAGETLSLQKHMFREEFWKVIGGRGYFTLDGNGQTITEATDIIKIKRGSTHRFHADEDTAILEESISDVIVAECDIIRLEDSYGRA